MGRLKRKAPKSSSSLSMKKEEPLPKRKKKDLMMKRKSDFRKRLAATEKLKAESDAKSKLRAKSGTMAEMDAIKATIDKLFEDTQETTRTKSDVRSQKPPKSTLKERKRKKEFMSQIGTFGEISRHPKFVASPLETVSTHVENKVQAKLM